MEIITISKDGEESNDTMSKLYEASIEGSVPSLESLVEKDSLILTKISLTTFSETPLHISALLGHTHFTRALLDLQPSLAWMPDSQSCQTPLHMASANGHVDVVRELLRVRKQSVDGQQGNEDMCLVKDGEGRVALHYAAMRGHVGVIELLVDAQPNSVLEKGPEGETVLHLCVQYNKLEALKFILVKSPKLINSTDSHGNTVLHLAVLLKQVATVKHLVTVPGLKQDTTNSKGLKASEILAQFPQTDFNTLKLRLILTDHYGKDDKPQPDQPKRRRCWGIKCLNAMHKTTSQWLLSPETRACIMVVAALISQSTFQSALNPPGGVWQDTVMLNHTECRKCRTYQGAYFQNTCEKNCNQTSYHMAGTSLLGSYRPKIFKKFMIFNATSFLASIGVIMLIVGGLPLTNKFCMWLTNVAMFVTLTFTAVTFIFGMESVMPINNSISVDIFHIITWCSPTWAFLLAILTITHTMVFLVSLFKKSDLNSVAESKILSTYYRGKNLVLK